MSLKIYRVMAACLGFYKFLNVIKDVPNVKGEINIKI